MFKANQLRDMAIEELEAAIVAVNQDLYKLVNNAKMTKEKVGRNVKSQKTKARARMLTILHEKRSALPNLVRGV